VSIRQIRNLFKERLQITMTRRYNFKLATASFRKFFDFFLRA
jgi:hypothetical protein